MGTPIQAAARRARQPPSCSTRGLAAATLAIVLGALCRPAGALPPQQGATDAAWSKAAGLAALVHPLRSFDDPGLDDELAAFVDATPALRNARVIALGEATHGTHEFFAFKHHMVRVLVERHGFRAFLMEASTMDVTALDDWVRGSGSDTAITKLMSRHLATIWNTVEVRALLVWMRDFNRSHPHDPVRFLGFDPQLATPSANCLTAFMAKAAPQQVPEVQRLVRHLTPVTHQFAYGVYPARPLAERLRARDRLLALLGRLTHDEVALSAVTSPAQYRRAQHCARLLVQSDETRNIDEDARERHMAHNIVLTAGEHGGRAIVWAHNFHIARVPAGFRPWGRKRDFKPMGAWLADLLGNGYYALGLTFDHGAFSAGSEEPGDRANTHLGLQAFSVDASAPGTFGAVLASLPAERFLIDLRGLASRDTGGAHAWFSTRHPVRYAGASFSTRWPESAYNEPIIPAAHFDGILFVRKTAASQPLPYRPERRPYTG